MADNYVIEMLHITKEFPGIKANDDITLQLRKGEIHALLGENGAGKSTLMRVLGGEHRPTEGQIFLDGQAVVLNSPHDAKAQGIAVIHQEMALAGDLTVAENIFLGELPGIIGWRGLYARAAALIAGLGFAIRPDALVGGLSVAHQQVVEIAKALSQNARVMVFDEPTAVLSVQDAERLLSIIDALRRKGVAIIYISHRLDEVMRIADRMTVLKDGQSVATVSRDDVSIDELIRLMVGRPLSALFGEDVPRTLGDEVLRVEGLCRGRAVRNASLTVRAGEIVGLGGLVGAGRTELVRLIFGADRADAGTVTLNGKPLKLRSPVDGVRAGIGLAPESRKDQGLILDKSIAINTTMARLKPLLAPLGFIRRAAERAVQFIDKTSAALVCVVLPDNQDPMEFLSTHAASELQGYLDRAQPLMDFVFEKRLSGADLSAPGKRVKALDEMAQVLAPLKHSVILDGYATRLADALGMDAEQTKRIIREKPIAEQPKEGPRSQGQQTARPRGRAREDEPPAYDEPAYYDEAPDDYVPYDGPVVESAPQELVALSADERMQLSSERELLSLLAASPDSVRPYAERIATFSWTDARHESMAWAMLAKGEDFKPVT